jgi:hypothetical protein
MEQDNKINIELDLLMDCVEKMFMIDRIKIQSKTRKINVVYARHAYCLLARQETLHTLKDIGDLINRNHSTIHHSIIEGEHLEEFNLVFRTRVEMCREVFREIIKDNILKEILDNHKNNHQICKVN